MKLNLLNDMARTCRLLSLLLLLAVGFAGCKTSRHSSSLSGESACLSSKVQLTVPHKDATLTVNGTMKLKKEECMQISFLMPILRTEVARMEVTPDEILLVDRMGKRYVYQRAFRFEYRGVVKRTLHQYLTVILQRIVRLIHHLVNDCVIEQHTPHCHQQKQQQCKFAVGVAQQLHSSESL